MCVTVVGQLERPQNKEASVRAQMSAGLPRLRLSRPFHVHEDVSASALPPRCENTVPEARRRAGCTCQLPHRRAFSVRDVVPECSWEAANSFVIFCVNAQGRGGVPSWEAKLQSRVVRKPCLRLPWDRAACHFSQHPEKENHFRQKMKSGLSPSAKRPQGQSRVGSGMHSLTVFRDSCCRA